ncbi:MAG: cobalt ECF transporter T component CbiQ [Desulfitobacteriaceae bacterium]
MFDLDTYAYTNRWINIHPLEKFAFALTTMLVCLISPSVVVAWAVLLLMTAAIVKGAGIPAWHFLRLMTVPFSFILTGVLTIAFSVSQHPGGFLFGFTLGSITVGASQADLLKAGFILFKSLGAVSCLYFLSLTTPVLEVISVLRKLKVPSLFAELMGLVYRFIFVLMDTTSLIRISQTSRLGYASAKNTFRSLSQLISSLFVRSFHRAQELATALMARNYTGEIRTLEKEYPVSRKNYIVILGIELGLLLLNVMGGGTIHWLS